jgi:hypothetical protein
VLRNSSHHKLCAGFDYEVRSYVTLAITDRCLGNRSTNKRPARGNGTINPLNNNGRVENCVPYAEIDVTSDPCNAL